MEFAENLKELLRLRGITAYRLSRDTGISEGLISDWKRGRGMPSSGSLTLLARYFGVSADSLLGTGTGSPGPKGIPVLGVIRAGEPVVCAENIEGYEFANVREQEEYFYLRVTGDSMSGAGIGEGALVLIHKQRQAENGQIVACLLEGETATLKRFRVQGEVAVLLPENSAYEPIIVPLADFESGRAVILGVAVSVTTKL